MSKKPYYISSSHSQISREEETEMLNIIKYGKDEKLRKTIRDKFILINIPLASLISVDYYKHYEGVLSIEDFISAGVRGLIRSVDKYDVNVAKKKGNKFSTYAAWWIKQSIRREIHNNHKTIRLPSKSYVLASKINKFICEYKDTNGHEPCIEHVIENFKDEKITESSIKSVYHVLNEVSINKIIKTFDDENEYSVRIINDKSPDPYTETAMNEDTKYLYTILDKLDERSKYIIIHRYGLFNKKIKTLEELSEDLNITRERVRQLQAQILKKLRRLINGENRILERKRRLPVR